jgi:uncharacterized protein YdbL (DUF1318 family)
MKRISLFVLTVSLFLLASPAFAADLNSARAQGLLGEMNTGFVQVLSGGGDVQQLATEVNNRRKQEYERISKENGQPVDVVGKLAAQQIVNKLAPGSKYQAADGSWKTR